ncbi:hypothetical protein ACFVYR_34465 [Streptomyces sp. NPDC058284]|uniref:hypothetical protein n=1 Tax=unclassified Streptomyces TaxID=2593676 RepID=UPI003646CA7B
MKSTVSRAVVAASVAAALGLTAACGGGNGGDGDKSSEPSKSAQAPAEKKAPALSAAALEKAVLSKDDIKGYKFEKISAAEMPSEPVPADPAACQSLADMFMFATEPAAKSRVGRTLTDADELDAMVVSLALMAHGQDDAEKIMEGLRTATKKCTAYEHADSKYRDVAALPTPEAGDESVSYKVVGLIEGQKTPMSFTVVRSGSTLAAFYSINLLQPKKFGVPKKIVEAQVDKLKSL